MLFGRWLKEWQRTQRELWIWIACTGQPLGLFVEVYLIHLILRVLVSGKLTGEDGFGQSYLTS
jgi:hypothetical protein